MPEAVNYAAKAAATRALVLLFLLFVSLFICLPFVSMLIQATHSSKEILSVPPPFLPGSHAFDNYANIVSVIPFWTNFLNSVLTSSLVMGLSLLFCSMGGFVFAMYDFPFKKALFSILLGTMMLPWLVDLVPWFVIISRLHWMNSYLAVVAPYAVGAFGVFWMRQYISSSIPGALMDAARIDGCPEGLIFFRIIAPLLGPAFAALGIMNFLNSWNNFFYPFLVLTGKARITLPLALNLLRGDPYRGMDYGVLMLGTSLALLPVMTVFWLASKKFISGMTAGAVKG
jgi:ABC-type glycerol-3-phosphate transport system permease component